MRRKRLEQALFELKSPHQQSIQQIAYNCGFSSQANFAKAFGAHFGFTASQYRKGLQDKDSKDGKLSSKIGKKSYAPFLYHGSLSTQDRKLLKQQCLAINIIDIEAEYYCYVASTQGYNLAGIEQAWQQLRELLASLNIVMHKDNQSVGYCQDNHFSIPLAQCRYEAGCQIEDPQTLRDKSIAVRTLESGKYLSAKYEGKISQLRHPFYLWLFSEYIPEHKILVASKTVVERYHKVDMKNDYIKLEILVKVY